MVQLHSTYQTWSLHTCLPPSAGLSLDQQQVEDREERLHHSERSHSPHRHDADALQAAGQTTPQV